MANRRFRNHAIAFAILAFLAAPAAAQDEPAKPDKPDPAVKEKLDTFEDCLRDRKFERDTEATQIIDELLQRYPELHEKDQRSFLKALDSVFRARQRKPEQPGLYQATIHALGTIGGEDAAKILVKVFDKKMFEAEEWASLQEDLLENIGRTKDEKQIDFLVKRAVRDPTDSVKRAAGKALRYFEDSDLKTRQDIFKELLINYGQIEGDSKSSLDPNNNLVATRKRTLAAIADPWNVTLSKLSGQNFRTAEEWQKWWNEAKYDKKMWKQ